MALGNGQTDQDPVTTQARAMKLVMRFAQQLVTGSVSDAIEGLELTEQPTEVLEGFMDFMSRARELAGPTSPSRLLTGLVLQQTERVLGERNTNAATSASSAPATGNKAAVGIGQATFFLVRDLAGVALTAVGLAIMGRAMKKVLVDTLLERPECRSTLQKWMDSKASDRVVDSALNRGAERYDWMGARRHAASAPTEATPAPVTGAAEATEDEIAVSHRAIDSAEQNPPLATPPNLEFSRVNCDGPEPVP